MIIKLSARQHVLLRPDFMALEQIQQCIKRNYGYEIPSSGDATNNTKAPGKPIHHLTVPNISLPDTGR